MQVQLKEKTCNICGVSKPLAEFSMSGHSTDGHHANCRVCARVVANANAVVRFRAYAAMGIRTQAEWSVLSPERKAEGWRLARMSKSYLTLVPKVKVNQIKSRRRPTTAMTRPGAARFRVRVLGRDKKCIITRTPVGTYLYSKGTRLSVIHAAHIIPHKMSTPQQYDDINNGLTMTAGMHADFDHAIFTIGDNKQILPSRWAEWDKYPPFIEMSDEHFTEMMRKYLARHRAWCMKQWNRWAF